MTTEANNENRNEGIEENENDEGFKIPHSDSKFKQQKLPACRPFLTPLSASIIYFFFCIVSLAFGLIYFMNSDDIFELKIEYSDQCENTTCNISFTVNENRTGPFFIYYQLTNFYQNSFLYGESKNWDQLRGKSYSSESSLDSCAPMISSGNNFTTDVYVPCGAVPMSVFNDTFTFSSNFPEVFDDDITLPTFNDLFKPANKIYDTANHWMNKDLFENEQTNPHFINWVQLAPFSTFRKLYYRTRDNATLVKGNYSVEIQNNFPVSSFDGKKYLIIAQIEWFGGKNRFFGIFFFVICTISGLCSIVFIILYFTSALPLYKSLKNSGGALDMNLLTT